MRLLGFLRKRSALPPLDEAEAYARCHGERADVKIVSLEPRRPRYTEVLLTGEQLRRRFEERLDAREPLDGHMLDQPVLAAASEEPES